MRTINRFCKNRSGAAAIEYGLIVALIGLVLMLAVNALGSSMTSVFTTIKTHLLG